MLRQIIRIQIENSIYDRLMEKSVSYALISLPYTINRMRLRDIQSRITNIVEGKISEKLFIHFCEQNEIPVQTEKCQTPFYLPDKRDFILGREEWNSIQISIEFSPGIDLMWTGAGKGFSAIY